VIECLGHTVARHADEQRRAAAEPDLRAPAAAGQLRGRMGEPAGQQVNLLVGAAPQAKVVVEAGHVPAIDEHIGLRQQLGDARPRRPVPELGEAVAGKADQRQVPLPPGDRDESGAMQPRQRNGQPWTQATDRRPGPSARVPTQVAATWRFGGNR